MTQPKRNRMTNARFYFGWISAVAVAVAIGYLLASYALHDSLIRGCNGGNTFRKQVIAFALDARDARAKSGQLDTAARYQVIADKVRGTVRDCDEAFPPPIPFIK